MKTMKKIILSSFIALFMLSCSKDDNSPAPVVEKKLYPKKMDIFYKDAQGIETFSASNTFLYNENKQVSSINYHGIGNINFTYNSNGLPSKIVSVFGSQQVVSEFEYNGERIIKLTQNNNTYDIGYNATTNTDSYSTQYYSYSYTLNSANDLTKRVSNSLNGTNNEEREFFYKNNGFGFLYDIDYPILFYLHFINLGFDFDRYISRKPFENKIIINSSGNHFTEYTNLLNTNNYVIESLLTLPNDSNGPAIIVRFEYQEL